VTTSRGEIKAFVLELLQKTAGYQGMFTETKANHAVAESMDYVASRLFTSGNGWMKRVVFLPTTANDANVILPDDVSVIDSLRFKSSGNYVPIEYYSGEKAPYTADGSNITTPSSYRFAQNRLLFNPPPDATDAEGVMLEYSAYPNTLVSDGSLIDPGFDKSMVWFLKYRAARILWKMASTETRFPFEEEYRDWEERVMAICHNRIRNPAYVEDFDP
jgi:hypothetical protein